MNSWNVQETCSGSSDMFKEDLNIQINNGLISILFFFFFKHNFNRFEATSIYILLISKQTKSIKPVQDYKILLLPISFILLINLNFVLNCLYKKLFLIIKSFVTLNSLKRFNDSERKQMNVIITQRLVHMYVNNQSTSWENLSLT